MGLNKGMIPHGARRSLLFNTSESHPGFPEFTTPSTTPYFFYVQLRVKLSFKFSRKFRGLLKKVDIRLYLCVQNVDILKCTEMIQNYSMIMLP